MKENKLEYLVWIIFASLGLIFIVVGLVVYLCFFNYQNKIETTGTITKISAYPNDNDVYVSYNVNGKDYENILNGYASNFYEGKKIKIYYDKDNPNKIGMKSLDLLFLIFPSIGLIFLIIGGLGIFVKVKKKRLEKSLKINGNLIYADYSETVINHSYWINGRYPYNIILNWINPVDNKTYIFKSKNIWLNPEEIIKEKNITKFPVYINSKMKYYVDIDILMKDLR